MTEASETFEGDSAPLTPEQGLRAYARMMNLASVSEIEPLLAEDFTYESQWVLTPIRGKSAFLEYIRDKLRAIARTQATVWAEMAFLRHTFPGPCVVMAQNDPSNLVSLVLIQVEGSRIKRLDMCFAPGPHEAERSGEYPGRKAGTGAPSF